MRRAKVTDPFRENPEEELKRRMAYAQPMTRDQFLKRIVEIKGDKKTHKK